MRHLQVRARCWLPCPSSNRGWTLYCGVWWKRGPGTSRYRVARWVPHSWIGVCLRISGESSWPVAFVTAVCDLSRSCRRFRSGDRARVNDCVKGFVVEGPRIPAEWRSGLRALGAFKKGRWRDRVGVQGQGREHACPFEGSRPPKMVIREKYAIIHRQPWISRSPTDLLGARWRLAMLPDSVVEEVNRWVAGQGSIARWLPR